LERNIVGIERFKCEQYSELYYEESLNKIYVKNNLIGNTDCIAQINLKYNIFLILSNLNTF